MSVKAYLFTNKEKQVYKPADGRGNCHSSPDCPFANLTKAGLIKTPVKCPRCNDLIVASKELKP